MLEEKTMQFKDLIDSFDSEFYVKRIEEKRQEINNIKNGKPISDRNPRIVPRSEVKKEIKRRENDIKKDKELLKNLREALYQLRSSSAKLEQFAEQEVLLDHLHKFLDFDRSSSIRGFKEPEIFKSNKDAYRRLHNKSAKTVRSQAIKISKKMYALIKKNQTKQVHSRGHYYETMKRGFEGIKINGIDKYTPKSHIFSDVKQEYGAHDDYVGYDKLKNLGVNLDIINYALEKMKGEPNSDSLTWIGKDAFEKLQNIKKSNQRNISIKGGYTRLKEIEQKYTEIVELSRETWYLSEMLDAFKNTSIKNTEMYAGLIELVREQEQELHQLTRNADKLYKKCGLENKMEKMQDLDEMFKELQKIEIKIERYKEMGYQDQVDFLRQEYYKIQYEMIKILKENPDLNKPEYNIDIEEIIKREMDLYRMEPRKEKNAVEQQPKQENIEDLEISSQPVVAQEELPEHVPTKEEEMFVERTYFEESKKEVSLELDLNLQIQRTMHYQSYMKEKVLNSDLGKIPFSEYLETVAPHLTELIAIEKEREKLARTIYKDYIKYLSALEDKSKAMSYNEYSERIKGISNIDVPVEYEEEYKEMIKK